MQMVGHKTEAMYRRYAITNDADLQAAAVKLGGTVGTPDGHNYGHSRPFGGSRRAGSAC